MSSDIDEAIDWRGETVTCDGCAHRELLARERCELKRACVHDRYARRIDRFFDTNKELADSYLDHPHFEVRAIAAKFADVFRLPALLSDPDETVRWNAVRRLPRRYLLKLREDPHREVRIRVASLLEGADLAPMMRDADYYVRLVVARRTSVDELPAMMADAEPEVRRVVASRLQPDMLWRMASDEDAEVRLAVAQRISTGELIRFQRDPDWRLRYETARRIFPSALADMADDPDEMVRALVKTRIEAQKPTPDAGNVVSLEELTRKQTRFPIEEASR